MKKSVTPYANQQGSKKKQVTKMFDVISTNYDFLNRLISLGIDIKWRKRVVQILIPKKPDRILDIATGTGDLALALNKTEASKIVGLDISPGMLAKGKYKVNAQKLENTIEMVLGDSEALKYKDDSFDINDPSSYPADFIESTGGITAFKIRYVQEAQNHFKSLTLDQA